MLECCILYLTRYEATDQALQPEEIKLQQSGSVVEHFIWIKEVLGSTPSFANTNLIKAQALVKGKEKVPNSQAVYSNWDFQILARMMIVKVDLHLSVSPD